MHAVRQQQFGLVAGDQLTTQQADKQARAEVARRIEEIFESTRAKVEERLARLDKEVNDTFDQGAEKARQEFETYVDERMTRWKLERYLLQPGGSLLWVKDQLLGLPEEVNAFYAEGRQLYVERMDGVIDQIAGAVEAGLAEAKQLINAGRTEVQTYVASLPENLRQVGEQAATTIQGKFDSLRQSVDEKGTQLVDQLAQKYVDNLGKLDERIGEMKVENRGLVHKAKEQIQGVIDTIIGLKNMLLGILAKAAAAIDKIIEDPIAFLGNLVAGVKAGLDNFMSNIGTHLKKGLMEWLFGALAGAGITLPETFDLKGIISLVLQVLGLTYANFRARAVAIVGEPIVKALEEAAEVFKILVTEGVGGLWRFIQEKIGDIKSMIMDAILAFVRDKVIIAGITWLIGLLNPASAFVKACKAIYDIVMFFVNRGSQIISLVNAIVDSIAAIANGAIGVAATWVENALARAIPVAIGFLAALLGLGDISGTIRSTIQKVQAPVNKAIDWVIHQAVKLVKAVGKFIGGLFGKKDKKKDEVKEQDPEKAAKVEAGLAAIDQAEQAVLKDGHISKEHADQVAAKVKGEHPVFKSIRVKDGGGTWNYLYEASPGEEKTGETKDPNEVTVEVGTTIVLIGKEGNRTKAWPAKVLSVDPGKSFTYEGPGGKRFTKVSGMFSFDSYKKLWRLVESDADLQVQEHHKIPWTNEAHWQHRLRVLSGVDLKNDSRNLMSLGGHAGPHSADYHATVQAMMHVAYNGQKETTQRDADKAMASVMAEIERSIGNGSLKPYEDREVWIP